MNWRKPQAVRSFLSLVSCLAACSVRLDAGHNVSVERDSGVKDVAKSAPFSLNGAAVDLQLNGDSHWVDGALVMTEAIEDQQGTAFFPQPFAIGANLAMDVHLIFQIDLSELPADGVALVWHADPMGARALGGRGGDLSIRSLAPGVAVVLDTHDGTGMELAPGVQFGLTSSVSSKAIAYRAEPFNLVSGKSIDVWVSIRGQDWKVFLSEATVKPSEPWIQGQFDLLAKVGTNVFFGVTSATGAKFSRHVVHALEVSKKE